MRYDSEHKALTRDRVLREAAAAIRIDGVERVGVGQIMARAGLTHGGFYAHFASKDDLIAQAVAYMFDDRYAAFLGHIDGPDPRTALIRFIDRYLSVTHRDARDNGCPIPALSAEVDRLPVAAKSYFLLGVERLTGGVAALLERMDASDCETTADLVIAEMVGALAMARVQPDAVKSERLLTAARTSAKARLGLDI